MAGTGISLLPVTTVTASALSCHPWCSVPAPTPCATRVCEALEEMGSEQPWGWGEPAPAHGRQPQPNQDLHQLIPAISPKLVPGCYPAPQMDMRGRCQGGTEGQRLEPGTSAMARSSAKEISAQREKQLKSQLRKWQLVPGKEEHGPEEGWEGGDGWAHRRTLPLETKPHG